MRHMLDRMEPTWKDCRTCQHKPHIENSVKQVKEPKPDILQMQEGVKEDKENMIRQIPNLGARLEQHGNTSHSTHKRSHGHSNFVPAHKELVRLSKTVLWKVLIFGLGSCDSANMFDLPFEFLDFPTREPTLAGSL